MQRKSLIAVAAAAVAAGATFAAQAQEKSVTFYGLLDVNLAQEKAGKLKRNGLDHSELNGTRFGVRGSTPIDGDLKGVFTLEGGFDTGTGKSEQGNTLLGRQVFAGIEGGFGRVTAGRQYSPAFVALDPFEATGGADRSAGLLHRKTGSVKRGYETRFDNMVKYRSPEFAGLSVDAGYWTGKENSSNDSDVRNEGTGGGLAVLYSNGPLAASAVAQSYYTNQTGGKAATHGAGLSFKTSFAKFYAQFSQDKESGSQGSGKAKTVSAGVEIPFTAKDTLAVSFGRRDESGESGAMDVTGASAYYLRALGKETTLYAAYSRLNNQDAATYGWNLTPAAGDDPSVVMVGLRQKF